MKTLFGHIALIGALFAPVALHATPLPISGQFSIDGAVTPGINQLVFDPATIETSIHTQTGDFLTILGNNTHVAATGGTPVINYNPYPGGAYLQFPNLNILIQSITEMNSSINGIPYEVFSGNVVFQSPGFADTNGTFAFSTQAGNEVSFSATGFSSGTPAVPEPSSIALLGTAALAGAGILKKRL